MFYREIIRSLHTWKEKPDRKPLVLRGARQVGKTTVVNMFSSSFDQYIYLNLERPEDLRIFDPARPFKEIVNAIFFLNEKPRYGKNTLVFIDEIQNSPAAVQSLRYFYEETPDIYVVAAGSVLESLMNTRISFPVGRVEYLAIHPFSFSEFLAALGEKSSLEILQQYPVPEFSHDKLISLFNLYALIGGMPAVIKNYSDNRDLFLLTNVYESLIVSYLDDVEKYARNNTLLQVTRHVISTVFHYSGTRITFERFGNSNYRSREVGEAFRTLEKAMLLMLIYPAEYAALPLHPNYRKSPRLQMLDTGLVNYLSKIQKEVFNAKDITDVFRGRIAEHIIGQELISGETSVLAKLHFWTREQKNSQAEIDFIISHDGKLIPVEVKSGASGKLKSLQLFMDQAEHGIAVRFWSGKPGVEKVRSSNGKIFSLLNLPFYLAGNLKEILRKVNNSGE
jgi:predicted AAA+ superfamily ATPase